jgi:hypothetical protein
MSIVKSKFSFLQIRSEYMLCHPMELSQQVLGVTPDGVNPIERL